MPLWAVVVLIVLAVLAAAAGGLVWVRDRREERRAAAALRRVPAQRIEPALRDRRLTAPPMVGDLTLRDWLVHFSTERDRVWPSVVATFYQRAAGVPEIADYFRETDMVRLQQHFARALTMVTGTGLTEATVRRLQQAHFGVHDSAGRSITPEVYDAVIGTLVGVLQEQGVPASAIGQLADTIAPLRAVIVRPAEVRRTA